MAQMFLFLLFLLTSFTGASSQFTMTQPASVSVSPGEIVSITCAREGGSISSRYVSWYKQKPGTKPLAVIYKDTERPSGIPDRFSASIDSSSNSATMFISNIQQGDEADYYCMSHDDNAQYVFGGGTDVTVTGQPTVSPSVQVFAPSREEVSGQNPYTVVCLVSEFYPPGFTLQWKDDKNQVIPSGAETTKATKQGDKYLASSYLRLSATEYENHSTFTCEVTHESKTIAKTVSKSGSC